MHKHYLVVANTRGINNGGQKEVNAIEIIHESNVPSIVCPGVQDCSKKTAMGTEH